MGHGASGMGQGDKETRRQGRIYPILNAQCPLPNAHCPLPNAQQPTTYFTTCNL
ncbi:histidine kinase [Tolypothrix sp. VBCCA 56010]|uniref:histidine kinase n=1 Tax=Tolypothrix sp. VBCCA 56010 TaxID=3137731 RepID=UPI003D7E3370